MNQWQVRTDTDEDDQDNDYLPIDGLLKGTVKAQVGSGKVTISPSSVEVGSTRNFDITYTAATAVTGYLWVEPPSTALKEADGTTDLLLTEDTVETTGDRAGSRTYGYINQSRISGDVKQVIEASGRAVVWGPIKFSKGTPFTKTIERAQVINVDNTSPGSYDWVVHFVIDDPITSRDSPGNNRAPVNGALPGAERKLYVLRANADPNQPDVTFALTRSHTAAAVAAVTGDTDPTAQTTPNEFEAAEDYRIVFTFTAENTPIKDRLCKIYPPELWYDWLEYTYHSGRCSG